MATAWAVPRNSRTNPVLLRLKSLLLLLFAGLSVLGISVLSAIASNTDAMGEGLSTTIRAAILVATVLVVGMMMTVLFSFAAPGTHKLSRSAPGAFTLAVMWQGLQYAGTLFVTNVLSGPASLNKTFGFVLGLMGIIFIASGMAVLGVEVNVVLQRRLWPRALLTPFTDSVDLTEADRRAYAMYAQMQRHKGFETVVVRFDGRDGDTHEIVLEPERKGPDTRGSVQPNLDPDPPPTRSVDP